MYFLKQLLFTSLTIQTQAHYIYLSTGHNCEGSASGASHQSPGWFLFAAEAVDLCYVVKKHVVTGATGFKGTFLVLHQVSHSRHNKMVNSVLAQTFITMARKRKQVRAAM